MGLTRDCLIRSLQRIFVLQNFHTDEVGPYAETIMESCGWMSALAFEEVCKQIVKSLKTNVRVKPGHFIGTYKELAALNGWDRGTEKVCSNCFSSGWIFIWVRNKDGDEYRAALGCHVCNQRWSSLRDGLTRIDEPFEQQRRISELKFKPWMAEILLKISDNLGFKVKPEILERLQYCCVQPDEDAEKARIERESASRVREEANRQVREAFAKQEAQETLKTAPRELPAEPAAAPAPAPRPVSKPAGGKKIPTRISDEDAAAMDMPF